LGEDFGLNLKRLKKFLYFSYASFDASDPISHGVHAGHFGIRSTGALECIFASSQFVFPELAAWLAEFNEHLLRVLTSFDHSFSSGGIVVAVFVGRGSDAGSLRHFKTGINFNFP